MIIVKIILFILSYIIVYDNCKEKLYYLFYPSYIHALSRTSVRN